MRGTSFQTDMEHLARIALAIRRYKDALRQLREARQHYGNSEHVDNLRALVKDTEEALFTALGEAARARRAVTAPDQNWHTASR